MLYLCWPDQKFVTVVMDIERESRSIRNRLTKNEFDEYDFDARYHSVRKRKDRYSVFIGIPYLVVVMFPSRKECHFFSFSRVFAIFFFKPKFSKKKHPKEQN